MQKPLSWQRLSASNGLHDVSPQGRSVQLNKKNLKNMYEMVIIKEVGTYMSKNYFFLLSRKKN